VTQDPDVALKKQHRRLFMLEWKGSSCRRLTPRRLRLRSWACRRARAKRHPAQDPRPHTNPATPRILHKSMHRHRFVFSTRIGNAGLGTVLGTADSFLPFDAMGRVIVSAWVTSASLFTKQGREEPPVPLRNACDIKDACLHASE